MERLIEGEASRGRSVVVVVVDIVVVVVVVDIVVVVVVVVDIVVVVVVVDAGRKV